MSSLLTDLRMRLQETYGVATCARVGQAGRAVEIANGALITDLERLLGEAARQASGEDSDRQDDAEGSRAAGPSVEIDNAGETIRLLLHQACRHLPRAVGIARAAELRATNLPTGIRLALEVEPLLYDVKHFINTSASSTAMSNPSGDG